MSSANLLQAQIRHQVGSLTVDVTLTLTQPWTVLFGPSGSGKTTVLRAVAGFVSPDAGRIVCGTQTVFDREHGAFVPAHLRPVRSAAQMARLFPNMSVREDLAYGARSRARSNTGDAPGMNDVNHAIVEAAIARFQLDGLMHKTTGDLSGGERQHIATVRAAISAVCRGPGTLLLLDEPFTGFDLPRRDRLLKDLAAWLHENSIPVLSVTHDVGEAFQIGCEVIRIAEGRVIAQGPVAEVLASERSHLIAQLSGTP